MGERRKQVYNDRKLQGYLLAGLISIELLLVTGLLTYLYAAFNGVIDDQLYRIHPADSDSWPAFVALLARAIGGFLLVNALALYLAHVIWGRYVRRTIAVFSSGLDRLIGLDFATAGSPQPSQHRILDLLQSWSARERDRNREIARLVERLSDHDAAALGSAERNEFRRLLQDYRCLLKDG